ncbi:H-NS family nucleoid-associated regulatory protein [Paracoccus sp. ME4]|uniref:H-NS histone family protein n=1 Tax=Paracoccus sp. ME4 TaxID=3138066 RepID=UPI00398B192C
MTISDVELDALDVADLKKIRRQVDAAIDGYAKRQMRIALEEIEAVAKKHGMTLDDITNARKFTKVRKPRPVASRYRNPKDASQIWTGRGRKPAWFTQAIEDGLDKNDMLIKD